MNRSIELTVVGTSLLLLVASGCRSSDAPSCAAVGAAYASLLQKEIEKTPAPAPSSDDTAAAAPAAASAEDRRKALSLIPLTKEAVMKECQAKQWKAEVRRCVGQATTVDDLERCQTREEEAPATTGAADEAKPAAPAAPAKP